MRAPILSAAQRRALRAPAVLAPLLLAALLPQLHAAAQGLVRWFPRCLLLARTGLWCPGCGNTRAVLLLLRGDLLGSLHHNPAPAILGVICALFYLEGVLWLWNRPVKLVPRTGKLWFPILGAALLCYMVRNFIPGMLP